MIKMTKSSWPFWSSLWGLFRIRAGRHDDRFVLKRQKAERLLLLLLLLLLLRLLSSAAPKSVKFRLSLAQLNWTQLLLLDIVCRDSPFSKQCGIVSISNLKNIQHPKKIKNKKEEEQPHHRLLQMQDQIQTLDAAETIVIQPPTAAQHLYI